MQKEEKLHQTAQQFQPTIKSQWRKALTQRNTKFVIIGHLRSITNNTNTHQFTYNLYTINIKKYSCSKHGFT